MNEDADDVVFRHLEERLPLPCARDDELADLCGPHRHHAVERGRKGTERAQLFDPPHVRIGAPRGRVRRLQVRLTDLVLRRVLVRLLHRHHA